VIPINERGREVRVRIGFEVQDVQDLDLDTSEALTERPYCLLGMGGFVDGQEDFHCRQYCWLLGFPEGRS
jgi:hypothetical protein